MDVAIPATVVNEQEVLNTSVVTEFECVKKFDKFLKCYRCQRRVQRTTSKVVKCNTCGIVKVDNCKLGITRTIAVTLDNGQSISIRMGDEILSKLMGREVIHLDEEAFSNELLFKSNVTVTYDISNYLVKDIIN